MQQQGMFERGDGHRSRRWAIAVLCAVCALALAMASTAQASVISIGSVLPKEPTPTKFERVQTFFNTALPQSGVNLASPVHGRGRPLADPGRQRRTVPSAGPSPQRQRRL